MKRNEKASCVNCPHGFGHIINMNTGKTEVSCSNSRGSYIQPHSCANHPNYYGYTASKCEQCAWIGSTFEIDKRPFAYCRRVAWAYHMHTVNNDDGVISAKVETSTGLVWLDSPACPAFMPREEEDHA